MIRQGVAAIAVAALAACSEAPPVCVGPVAVAEAATFGVVPASDDPYEPRDAGVIDAGTSSTSTSGFVRGRCGAEDLLFELLGDVKSVSVITRGCSRGTIAAPITEAIAAQEPMEVRIWHFALLPLGPAQAQLRLDLEGQNLWSRGVPIPSESELIVEPLIAPRAFPRGTEMRWHVENHGTNSWNFIGLFVQRPAPCPPG
jgi:hypothetical protein